MPQSRIAIAPFMVPLDLFVDALYPLSNYGGSPGIALGAYSTDGVFAYPERNSVRSLSQFVTTLRIEKNPCIPGWKEISPMLS